METLNYLVIHSTNTSQAKNLTRYDVIKHHTTPIRSGGLGFNRPGFDDLILRDGTLEVLVNENSPTDVDLWGISGGKYPILGKVKHIGYVGGRTLKEAFWKDTRSEAQKQALEVLINYYILRYPDVIVLGFDDPTAIDESRNPAFDVRKWLELNMISEKNQYRKPTIVRTS